LVNHTHCDKAGSVTGILRYSREPPLSIPEKDIVFLRTCAI
jgi:hypothetical protein